MHPARSDNVLHQFETANFLMVCTAEPELEAPEDMLCDPSDVDQAREGGSAWFAATVRVYRRLSDDRYVELGADHLGCCSYDTFDDFVTGHRRGSDDQRNTLATKARGVVICHYYPDMVRQAIEQARHTLKLDFGIMAKAGTGTSIGA